MAVLSSLLGVGQQQPVAGPAIATTAFPAELAPYYKDILSKAQALYEDRTAEGYQPYQGPTIAEFTPEQQQAFAGIAGLAGQQAPKFAEAEQLTRQAAAPIETADIEQFMNPYQQAVVDIEKREAQKQFEQKTLPSIRAAQVAQGAFGGTRGTLLEAQTLAEQDRLLADIQARGSQQAFNQALQQAQAQRAREGQAAAQLATMAPQAFKAQLGELGAVQTVGEEKQRQAQTALNEAYKQFVEERQFPQQSLGQYQAVVQAQPASQMLETVQYAPPPPPLGQQLLGGLGTLVGTYGAFGGFSPGGPSFNTFFNPYGKKYGGRVVQRQEGGRLPVVKRSRPGRIGYGLFGRQGLFGTRFGLGGGLAGALNNAYSQGMQMGTSGQGNLVENIQSAGRDLAGLRGSTDRHVQAITAAANAIGNTLSSTLGGGLSQEAITDITTPTTPVDQSITDVATPKEVAMKAGGGLRSLPVVKRQMSGPVDDTRMIEQLLEQDRQIDALSSRLSKAGLTSLDSSAAPLGALEQFVARYPKLKSFFSGEMAEKQAQDFDELQKRQLAELKKATPQVDRFAGLAEAARRVMGADPSKGFINALVQGMSGLDEGQREAYLKQKEQELKLLELKQEGEIKSLERKQAAETEGAKGPLKLAQLSKALKGTYRKFDSTVQKTLTDAVAKELGLQAQLNDRGEVISIKNLKGKDVKPSDLKAFNRLFSQVITDFARFDKTSGSAAEALSQTLRGMPRSNIPKVKEISDDVDTARTPLDTSKTQAKNVTGLIR